MQLFVAYTFDDEEENKVFFKNKILSVNIKDLSDINQDVIEDMEGTLEMFEEDIGRVTIINYKVSSAISKFYLKLFITKP